VNLHKAINFCRKQYDLLLLNFLCKYLSRTEHRFYAENIRISQHETQNVKTHNRTTQKTKKMSNTDPTKNTETL
jgi:hypothetical protein